MKRLGHFFYYLWALLGSHYDTNTRLCQSPLGIWSVSLAWWLAGIAAAGQEEAAKAAAKRQGEIDALKTEVQRLKAQLAADEAWEALNGG